MYSHLSEVILSQGDVKPRLGRVETGLIVGNNGKPVHKLFINLKNTKVKKKYRNKK